MPEVAKLELYIPLCISGFSNEINGNKIHGSLAVLTFLLLERIACNKVEPDLGWDIINNKLLIDSLQLIL